MPTLDDLRTRQEAKLEKLLARYDRRHRAMLKAALKEYGRVQDIPQEVWDAIEADMQNEEIAAAVLLAVIIGDEWTTDELRRQRVQTTDYSVNRYAIQAARQTQETAAQTTETLKSRLARKVEDMKASGPGSVGELTNAGIDQALDDVLTAQRRATIATDQTTRAFTAGQKGAAERGDGASTTAGQRVELELYWVTERDNLVCPRCAPLHDKPESVWGLVFPNGPGPEAHPNCRCSLRPVVIVSMNQEAA
jgi:hypothetical protein